VSVAMVGGVAWQSGYGRSGYSRWSYREHDSHCWITGYAGNASPMWVGLDVYSSPTALSLHSGWLTGITYAISQYTHGLASSFLEGCNVLTAAVSTPEQCFRPFPSLLGNEVESPSIWSYEGVAFSHIVLAGLLFAASTGSLWLSDIAHRPMRTHVPNPVLPWN
jgi:hypothetical protein